MAGRHRAPKEPSHLVRNAALAGVALSSATAGVTAPTPPAVAAPILAHAGEEPSSPPVDLAAAATYTVVSGDWLSTIAPRVGVSTADLYRVNRDLIGANPNLIHPGQVLTIAASAAPAKHAVPPAHLAPFQAPMASGSYTITSGYATANRPDHRGIDMGAAMGTPGYAVADGTVMYAGEATGFGLWTVIRSEVDGQVVDFVYGHMNHLTVAAGDVVRVGDHVMDVGDNGRSTGPHLHFEVWIGGRMAGHSVEPIGWLKAHGVNV